MGASTADHPTDYQATTTATTIPPHKSRAFRFGLALGWPLLLAYAAWLAHNALPRLTGAPLFPILG